LLPEVYRLSQQLITEVKKYDKKARILEGYRSIEKQNEYYEQGRTKPGKIITNAKGGQSFHNYRVAFDIYTTDYDKAGKIGKSLGLEWGGDWKTFKDLPHYELKKGYKIKDFQQNKVDYSKYQ